MASRDDRSPGLRSSRHRRSHPEWRCWAEAIATARSTVLAPVDGTGGAYACRADGDRHLVFAFLSGRRAAVVAGDRVGEASGCTSRTIEAPAARHAAAGRARLPVRWGAEARRRTQRSSAPRPLRLCAAAHNRTRHIEASARSEPSWASPTADQAALRAIAPEPAPFCHIVQVENQRAALACSRPTVAASLRERAGANPRSPGAVLVVSSRSPVNGSSGCETAGAG